MNVELSKISDWAKENKLLFNEQKSQVMLMTRRKRKDNKEVKIYEGWNFNFGNTPLDWIQELLE